MTPGIRWYVADGEPVQVGGMRVTPHSRVLEVRVGSGAFVWQRPTSISVDEAGRVSNVPIVDVTFLGQFALIGMAVVVAVLAALFSRRQA
jgi:hypothetical protein